MKNISLSLLTAAAIGAISIASASAMPLNNGPAVLGESQVQDVRLVCYQNGRCYNTRRSYRSARRQYVPVPQFQAGPAYGYYGEPAYGYSGGPGYGYYGGPGYGYYGGPRVGIGLGPFGIMVR